MEVRLPKSIRAQPFDPHNTLVSDDRALVNTYDLRRKDDMQDVAFARGIDAIDEIDRPNRTALQPCLLQRLSDDGQSKGLPRLDTAAWKKMVFAAVLRMPDGENGVVA